MCGGFTVWPMFTSENPSRLGGFVRHERMNRDADVALDH